LVVPVVTSTPFKNSRVSGDTNLTNAPA